MSNYELWAKHKEKSYYEKICEFEGRWEIQSRIDELIETGNYVEVTVIKDYQYIAGKEYKKSKVKRK